MSLNYSNSFHSLFRNPGEQKVPPIILGTFCLRFFVELSLYSVFVLTRKIFFENFPRKYSLVPIEWASVDTRRSFLFLLDQAKESFQQWKKSKMYSTEPSIPTNSSHCARRVTGMTQLHVSNQIHIMQLCGDARSHISPQKQIPYSLYQYENSNTILARWRGKQATLALFLL